MFLIKFWTLDIFGVVSGSISTDPLISFEPTKAQALPSYLGCPSTLHLPLLRNAFVLQWLGDCVYFGLPLDMLVQTTSIVHGILGT